MPKIHLVAIKRLIKNHYIVVNLLLVVVLVGLFFLYRGLPDHKTSIARLSSSAVRYNPDASGTIELKELGIAISLGPELAKQGLLGVPSTGYGQSTKSIAFTTTELAKANKGCDGIQGTIGTVMRYEGASTSMTEHVHMHGSTAFDYPGFHIVYQTTGQSCVASIEGYSPDELAKESIAARQLWDAVRTAQPL
jgi:hypothetical protein